MTAPDFSLTGRVALVTGSSRGIGRALAGAFAAAGARVVISSRRQEACEAAAAEIVAAGGDAIARACHVGREEELDRLVREVGALWGGIDCLVVNAAVNPVLGPLTTLPGEAWDRVMQANLRSTWRLCAAVMPGMAARGGGAVILVSSIAAGVGSPVIGAYGVSKAGVSALMRSLAVEYGPAGIRVNAIAPGVIATDFSKALVEDPAGSPPLLRRIPLGRFGAPADLTGTALLLASEAGRYITGQTLVVDGGLTIADPTRD